MSEYGKAKGEVVLPIWEILNTIRPDTSDEVINVDYNNDSVLTDANYLYDGYKRAKTGSAWKPEVQQFEANYLLEIAMLQKEIEEQSYKTAPQNSFIIHERGRVRLINSLRMKDRVVRHVYCDHVLNPMLRPKLIYDNYASLTQRGITMARNRFERFLHEWYRKHKSNEGWIMIQDYSGFYDNILHEVLKEAIDPLLASDMDRWMLSLILSDSLVDVSFMTEEERMQYKTTKLKILDYDKIPKELKTGKYFWPKSLNIGDQGSQSLSTFYPVKVDNFIKIVCGVRYYGRYMDDSFIIAETKEELKELQDKIKKVTDSIGIFLNPKKTRIFKLSSHFRFLQMQYSLTETGRIIIKINPKRLTAMRRRLKKLKKRVEAGKMPYSDVENMFRSWYGNFYSYMSKLQKINLILLYDSLFEKERKGVSIWKSLQIMVSRLRKRKRCKSIT